MLVIGVLVASILVQVATAIAALRLIPVTGKRLAWGLISLALVLMTLRRIISLDRVLTSDLTRPPDLQVEVVALFISILMFVGVLLIAPIFRSLTRESAGLRKRETHFFELSANLLCIASIDGYFRRLNAAWERTLGYDRDELINRPFLELVHPDDRADTVTELERLRDGRTTYSFTNRYRKKDGSYVWLEWTTDPPDDDSGLLYAVAHDITTRKAAEDALRDNERLLGAIIDYSPAVIYLKDCSGAYVRINRQFERLFNITNDEIRGKTDREIFPAEVAALVHSNDEHVARTGQSIEVEEIVPHDDGPHVYISTKFALRNAAGDLYAVAGISTDITERKAAEVEMRKSRDTLDSLVELRTAELRDRERRLEEAQRLGKIGDWEYDLDSAEIRWSPEVYRLFRRDPADGPPTIEESMAYYPPTDRRALEEFVDKILRTGEEGELALSVLLPDGAVAYHYSTLRAARDENGNVKRLYGTVQDVTARKEAEEARIELELQVQQAQKMESLGVLAGGIAHDFNNLLVAILGNADLALQELTPSSTARPYIEGILTSSRRAAELSKQMLAYSGRGKFVVTPVSLSEIVREMAHLLDVSVSKRAALQLDLEDGLPAIEADATQIRQVVMNLITNASEALGDKNGVITLRTGMLDCDEDYLSSSFYVAEPKNGPYVFVEVSDTGCGMDANTINRIFDPFFTTKFTGRGLGMAAVLGIVRGHKGGIRVYSEPGKGTTFKLLFPSVSEPARAVPLETGEQPAGWDGGGTILIVDDEAPVRNMAMQMLERAGFNVLCADDGDEGVRLFQAHQDDILVVLLDMTMPRMNGDEAFRHIQKIKPGAKVILSSGFSEQEATNRFTGKGLAAFIQKPYRLAQLAQLVISVARSATQENPDE